MIKYYEEQRESKMMYEYVMRNSNKVLKTKDEIIEYLVEQCYYIDLHNDQLIDTIDKLKSILDTHENIDFYDDLPF